MVWMIGAFVFCPCHLPITLSALALLLGGTVAGAALRAHPYIAGDDRHAAVGGRHVARFRAGQARENRGTVVTRSLLRRVWRSTGSIRSTGVGLPSRSSVTR